MVPERPADFDIAHARRCLLSGARAGARRIVGYERIGAVFETP